MVQCHDSPCALAFENPKRTGRASYECATCGRDISLHIILLAQVMEEGAKAEEELGRDDNEKST